MTRKLTITYDRHAGRFSLTEDTEHGGTHQFHADWGVATEHVGAFVARPLWRVLGPLMDGRLTSITLEAP